MCSYSPCISTQNVLKHPNYWSVRQQKNVHLGSQKRNQLPLPPPRFSLVLVKMEFRLKKTVWKSSENFKVNATLLHHFCSTRNRFNRRVWANPYKPKYPAVMGNDEGKWFQGKSLTIPLWRSNKRVHAIATESQESEIRGSSGNVQILTCSSSKRKWYRNSNCHTVIY